MEIDVDEILRCYDQYIEFATGKKPPTKQLFLQNMMAKERDRNFSGDMEALLRPEIDYNQQHAFEWLKAEVIERMK